MGPVRVLARFDQRTSKGKLALDPLSSVREGRLGGRRRPGHQIAQIWRATASDRPGCRPRPIDGYCR
jgi:hypothetical protein